MLRHRSCGALVALVLASLVVAARVHAAPAATACDAACQAMVREAGVLQAQGKYEPALAKLQAAASAAPQASLPLGATAYVLYQAAAVNPAQAGALRDRARVQAQAALRLNGDDPLAQETLRMLDAVGPSPLHAPNPAAAKSLADGEALFTQGRYDDALARYQEAMRLDPQASAAWVAAGDCWFMRKDWAQAAALFRKATEIEPRNAQAWRFLSDALMAQGDRGGAERALESGIAADPAQLPDWSKLAQLRQQEGKPLKPLHLQRGTRVSTDADGKVKLEVDADLQKRSTVADNGMRLAVGVMEAKACTADTQHKRSAYDIEMEAWRGALQSIDEITAKGGEAPSDPALVQMRTFARDGQLEPAVLLLLYRESYRPALEAWVGAHPDGVRTFIERYGMRP